MIVDEKIDFLTSILWNAREAFTDGYALVDLLICFGVALFLCKPWESHAGVALQGQFKRLGESEDAYRERIRDIAYKVNYEDGYKLRRVRRILACLGPAAIIHDGLHGLIYRAMVLPTPGWGFRFFSLIVLAVGVFSCFAVSAYWDSVDYGKCRELDPSLPEYAPGVDRGARIRTPNMNPTASSSAQGKSPDYVTDRYSLDSIIREYQIQPAQPGEPAYRGYAAVTHDGEGTPDPLFTASAKSRWESLAKKGLSYGTPGVGLGSADFGQYNKIGARGEKALSKIMTFEHLPVVCFWSLYGLDRNLKRIDADIDSVFAGIDRSGTVHLWFVDAKNYMGGSDTVYLPSDEQNRLLRVSVSKHAFYVDKNGDASLPQSTQMAFQLDNWQNEWNRTPGLPAVATHWRICSVPTGQNGTPVFHESLKWPGGIKAVTVQQLVDEIRNTDLLHPANIPLPVIELLKTMVKREDGQLPVKDSVENAQREQSLREQDYQRQQEEQEARRQSSRQETVQEDARKRNTVNNFSIGLNYAAQQQTKSLDEELDELDDDIEPTPEPEQEKHESAESVDEKIVDEQPSPAPAPTVPTPDGTGIPEPPKVSEQPSVPSPAENKQSEVPQVPLPEPPASTEQPEDKEDTVKVDLSNGGGVLLSKANDLQHIWSWQRKDRQQER